MVLCVPARTHSYYPASLSSKPPSHVPVLSVSSMTATVSAGASALAAMWVEDVDTGNIIYYVEASPSDNVKTFEIPAGVNTLKVFEHCALHGVWESAAISLYEARNTQITAWTSEQGLWSATNYPAQFASKIYSHPPTLTLDSTQTTATVYDGASALAAIWVTDQLGNPIFLHTFNNSGDTVSFTVPAGVTYLTPYAHCALHASWVGPQVGIQPPGGSEASADAKEALNILYTSSYSPPALASKPPSHVPILSVSDGTATLTAGASALSAVWVRDQVGNVVYYADTTTAVTTFYTPSGSTSLTAYAHCGLHGVWVGATYHPSWEADAASRQATEDANYALPGPYNAT